MPANPQMPTPKQPKTDEDSRKPTSEEIVQTLQGYKTEAETARRTGPNPRDDKWTQNLDLYWGRYDFSNKASWQAQETMPEVAGHVDRFASALKEALITAPDDFYTVVDPADREGDIAKAIQRMTNVWLTTAGRNQNGHTLAFPSVFEEQAKLGALMTTCSTVLWKNDVAGGRVAVETVDPRNVWLDPTFRNLYRRRRITMDLHDLKGLAGLKDSKGQPLFDLEEIQRLVANRSAEIKADKEKLTGQGSQAASARPEVVLDEWLATIPSPDGSGIAYDRALMVVADDNFLIRGPEKNPFWHGKDWLLTSPLITVPLSVYGRAYMEDFGSVAQTFNQLTNMILDAVHVSGMKVYSMVPDMLKDPKQAAEGIHPQMVFMLEDGSDPKSFLKEVELGNLSSDVVAVWKAMKDELREAGKQNEIGLGQFAPNSRTSATEVSETQQSTSAFVRSVAQSIEVGWLNPTLDLVWKTGLQHVSRNNNAMREAVGEQLWNALISNRQELIRRPVTFQARGISTMIQKSRILRSLLGLLQIIASSEPLLNEFLRVVDMPRLVEVLFELSDIDLHKLQASQRTRMIRQIVEQMPQPQPQPGSQPSGQVQQMARQSAQAVGGL